MGHMEKAAETYAKALFPALQTVSPATLLDLQSAMLDATPDCIKVLSRDGTLLMMNRAGCLALNVPRESGFGMPWLSLLPPEVYEEGKKALTKAAGGERVRFQGKSRSPGGFMYWDNILIPLVTTTAEDGLTIYVSPAISRRQPPCGLNWKKRWSGNAC